MKQSGIRKGLLVLVVMLLLALPGISSAAEAPPDTTFADEGVVLQNGETLDAGEVNHLQVLIRIYKENGMEREADIVERMLAGKLNDWEVKQLTDNQINGFPGFIDTDTWPISPTHILFTTVQRNWWMLGQNEHTGWSGNPVTGGNVPIDRIHMLARAWDSSGALQYSHGFSFAPASSVYSRDWGPSSGSARSDVTYQDGGASVTRTASGSY